MQNTVLQDDIGNDNLGSGVSARHESSSGVGRERQSISSRRRQTSTARQRLEIAGVLRCRIEHMVLQQQLQLGLVRANEGGYVGECGVGRREEGEAVGSLERVEEASRAQVRGCVRQIVRCKGGAECAGWAEDGVDLKHSDVLDDSAVQDLRSTEP